MSSANITKDEWDLTSKERLEEIKKIKSASSAVEFFKKWPPYVDSCIYVCIIFLPNQFFMC